jgi:hypothetical protein
MPCLPPRAMTVVGCLVLCLLAASAFAQDFPNPEQELAQKIVAVTGPTSVTIEVVSRSSLSQAEVERVRDALRSALLAAGVKVVSPDAAATRVRLSLSENLQGYLWVAQVQHEQDEPVVIMLTVAGRGSPPNLTPALRVSIRNTLLWSQKDPVLDLDIVDGNPKVMLVLGAERVTELVLRNAAWEEQGTASITHRNAWPRDLRGHLVRRGDGTISAYLPGVVCDLETMSGVRASCRESNDAWPLGSLLFKAGAFFAPSRNFFTALLASGGQQMNASPFYSAAPVSSSTQTAWLLAGIDGKVHLVSGVRDQVLGGLEWGSDVAGVQSQCGTKWQVLATTTANGETDSVQAYEVSERSATAVSQPAEIRGSITALWSDFDGSGAIAVAENHQTGMYEAYRLTLVCGE